MNSVLLIDDDKELCTLMKKCVEQENLSAVVAHGGLEGLRLLEENKDTCSLIILDVMMPDMNGFQVLQEIRKKNNVPVLMLTAKSDEEDKVSGLRLGADDYLTKPFGINELMARVNSLIRRYTTLNPVAGSEAATMLLKDMVIDKVNRTVTLQNLPVELTGKEFDLLVFLASNKGRVFTKKQIYTQVWAEEAVPVRRKVRIIKKIPRENIPQRGVKHIPIPVAVQRGRVVVPVYSDSIRLRAACVRALAGKILRVIDEIRARADKHHLIGALINHLLLRGQKLRHGNLQILL